MLWESIWNCSHIEALFGDESWATTTDKNYEELMLIVSSLHTFFMAIYLWGRAPQFYERPSRFFYDYYSYYRRERISLFDPVNSSMKRPPSKIIKRRSPQFFCYYCSVRSYGMLWKIYPFHFKWTQLEKVVDELLKIGLHENDVSRTYVSVHNFMVLTFLAPEFLR